MRRKLGLFIIVLMFAGLSLTAVMASYDRQVIYVEGPSQISLSLPTQSLQTPSQLTAMDSSAELRRTLHRISGHIQGFAKELIVLIKLAVDTGFETLIDLL